MWPDVILIQHVHTCYPVSLQVCVISLMPTCLVVGRIVGILIKLYILQAQPYMSCSRGPIAYVVNPLYYNYYPIHARTPTTNTCIIFMIQILCVEIILVILQYTYTLFVGMIPTQLVPSNVI
jgi:hypothetical protein